ncbi:MAG TPA: oxidoreductase [Lentisphaeria bacterium]|nr:MAG: hypothetical protein A2X45_02790 [Lentisphaerae bacterium GWF2_50_93]HCE45282.1 oxidoreductase [Lentisphaeria bacterium]
MKKFGWLILLGSQFAIVAGFWSYDHVNHMMGNQLTGDAVGQYLAYGRLAGLLAVLGILFQLMLIGRIKWLEQAFGLDRMAHLHHFTGFAIVVFLAAHPFLVTTGHSMQSGMSRIDQYIDFCRNWDDVLAAVIGVAIMSASIFFSILVMRKWVKYEIWYYSHLTLYVAVALVFGHQFEVGTDLVGNRLFSGYWYALYAFVFANLIHYRILRPIIFYMRHRFAVDKLVSETGDVTSVYIEGRGMEFFPVEAGQFMIVRFWAKGFRWEAHPFSMSIRPDGRKIRLSIKASGDFTRRIPGLKPGTPVFIDGPHGIFTSASCSSSKVLLIAGGIGITPIRALAEEMSAAGRDVILIYANRSRSSIVFEKELDELVEKSKGNLKIVHVLSDDPEWAGEKGRLDKEKISRFVPDIPEREVFLCGPPMMMKLVRASLSELNVPKARIHFEKFAL